MALCTIYNVCVSYHLQPGDLSGSDLGWPAGRVMLGPPEVLLWSKEISKWAYFRRTHQACSGLQGEIQDGSRPCGVGFPELFALPESAESPGGIELHEPGKSGQSIRRTILKRISCTEFGTAAAKEIYLKNCALLIQLIHQLAIVFCHLLQLFFLFFLRPKRAGYLDRCWSSCCR